MDIKTYLSDRRELVENALEHHMVPAHKDFADHLESIRYSLFAGGKRVRPILCLAAAETICDDPLITEKLLPVACALECIHTYSLIHDDLPAMDDDDLRRGKPTNHKIWGEAAAILAGDSLLTWAFDLLSEPGRCRLPADVHLAILHTIARAAGPLGMVGGQALDIANEHKDFPFSMLQTIHRNKTGALITCAVQVGGIGSGATPSQLQQLTIYGEQIGLGFQIVDDLLNATATTEQLGKAAGSDKLRGKATYPAYFGLDATREMAQQATDRAIAALEGFDHRATPLRALADYILTRSR